MKRNGRYSFEENRITKYVTFNNNAYRDTKNTGNYQFSNYLNELVSKSGAKSIACSKVLMGDQLNMRVLFVTSV